MTVVLRLFDAHEALTKAFQEICIFAQTHPGKLAHLPNMRGTEGLVYKGERILIVDVGDRFGRRDVRDVPGPLVFGITLSSALLQ